MKYTDLILDFETLSNDSMEAIVTSIAVYKFNFDMDPSFEDIFNDSLYVKFKIEEQKNLGWKVSKSTIEWWQKQSAEARKNIIPSDEDITLSEFVDQFIFYIEDVKIKRIWVRGGDFDPILLRRIFQASGYTKDEYDKVIPFWGVRDIRSYLEGFGGFSIDQKFIPDDMEKTDIFSSSHDPRYDIGMDLKRILFLNKE